MLESYLSFARHKTAYIGAAALAGLVLIAGYQDYQEERLFEALNNTYDSLSIIHERLHHVDDSLRAVFSRTEFPVRGVVRFSLHNNPTSSVSFKNIETGLTFNTVTNDSGKFEAELVPGRYLMNLDNILFTYRDTIEAPITSIGITANNRGFLMVLPNSYTEPEIIIKEPKEKKQDHRIIS